MAEIVLSQIEKTYPGDPAVNALTGIELTVKDEEFLSILGPSGCGKSTLLEIVAGLQSPSSGRVFLDGEPVTGPEIEIGVVFQDPSLFPWRTVMENIEFGLELRGLSRPERREIAQRYIELVKLKGFEKKYPHQLSGGMRQRAGLARTLANNPKILLMDEPFGAVDHLTRLQLQDDLLEIWETEKKTVVFVTHDVPEAVFLGDRVVILSARPGRVQAILDVTPARPRHREDPALVEVHDAIYRTIYAVRDETSLEYTL